MPTVKFGNHGITNTKEAVDAELEGGFYSGHVPQERGVYPCFVKILDLVTNKNGDAMVKGLAIVDAPKKHKFAEYNGYGIWFQQNVTDQGTPFVNQLLNALSDGTAGHARKIRTAFWEGGIQTEKPLPKKPSQSAGAILKIGPLRFMDLDEKKIRILIAGKPGSYNGEAKLEAARYIMKTVEEDEDDEDEDEIDGLDEFSGDSEASVDIDDEDEDDDEDDDEEDEDDEEPESEPEVVTPIKKKAASKKTRKEPAF